MIPYFYHSLGVAWFPFKWSNIVAPSSRVVINEFSVEEKDSVETLEKLSSDIITLKWEGIECTDLIQYSEDLAILQKYFCEFLIYCFVSLFLSLANVGNLICFSLQVLI